MTTIIFLFAIGVLMIVLEIFLPGGVLGVLGGLAMLAGSILAFRDYGAGGGTVAILSAVVLLVAAFVVEFVFLPRTAFGRRLFLSASVTGSTSAAADPQTVVGKSCEAVTALAPSGVVLLDGKKYEAFSRDGFVESGTKLVVRGNDNFRLIVSKS